MRLKTPFIALSLGIILSTFFLACNENKKKTADNSINKDYIADWQNQKYSMFIHWGLYAIPAGVWNGKQITGYSEQIKGHANIPKEEYRKLAKQFNPTHWNADSVTLLAKKAGMKSIVITAKHHDGFCLFDSKFTDFDMVDATPYKKDILKDLSESCQRQGLKFGVYFSLIDWDYEGALPFTSVKNSDSIPPQHHQYNLHQVEELLTNYGQISEIWFDMGAPTKQQSEELRALVKELQPNCLISGRIWNDQGDFVVMGDNKKPEYKVGVPWQTPASMFDETWGYRSWQVRKNPTLKAKEKLQDLLTVVSSGGNYLLNIGPKADGSIVPFEKEVLTTIGYWLKENGEAVYGTTSTSIEPQDWGMITTKKDKLFLLVYPSNKEISIKGLKNSIDKAYPLADKQTLLDVTTTANGVSITLPENLVNKETISVLVLEYKGNLDYINPKALKINSEKEVVTLTNENTDSIHSYSGHDYYSTRPTLIKMSWNVVTETEKEFVSDISFTTTKAKSYVLTVNDKAFSISKDNLNNGKITQTINIGKLKKNTNNNITLSFENLTNPNEDLGLECVNINIK